MNTHVRTHGKDRYSLLFFFRIDWTFHAMMCLCLFVAGSKPEDYITRYPPFFQGWHRFSQQGEHHVFTLPRLHSDALSLWKLLDPRDRHSMSDCSVSPNAPWRLWTVFRATSICCTTMNATRSGITGLILGSSWFPDLFWCVSIVQFGCRFCFEDVPVNETCVLFISCHSELRNLLYR